MRVHLHVNFLAHFYLSGQDENLLIGNFIADGVKGSRYNDYPNEIRKGILMHRFIDHYTDTHAVVRTSKQRLWNDYRHFAPVIIDVFYDHFLAANWNKYHSQGLADFAQGVYAVLEKAEEVLPAKYKSMLPYMKRYDWLNTYAHVEGIHEVLTGMSRRTAHVSGMENASKALTAHYEDFQSEFEMFFPQLQDSSAAFLRNYANP